MLVALRHATLEAPRPAHAHARVEEVVDVAVQHLRVRDVRESHARSLRVEPPALADRAVRNLVERRRPRCKTLDDAARQFLARRDVSPLRAHPHAARAKILEHAVDDSVGRTAVVKPERVVARVAHRAVLPRKALHALRRHEPVVPDRRLVLPGLGRTLRAVRRGRVARSERQALERDVVHVAPGVGLALELDETAQLRARRNRLQLIQFVVRPRTVQHLARLHVVEPLARRVERAPYVLEADKRLARVPLLPAGPVSRRPCLHGARRGIEPAQDAPREAPLVHHAHLRVGHFVGGERREFLHAVGDHEMFGERGRTRTRRNFGLRHVEVAGVRQACPVRASAIHPQLLEVDGLAVRAARCRGGPPALPRVLPSRKRRTAGDHRALRSNPRNGRLRRAGVSRREEERMVERVDARLHADRPGGGVACGLRRADFLERTLRRKAARSHNELGGGEGERGEEGESGEKGER